MNSRFRQLCLFALVPISLTIAIRVSAEGTAATAEGLETPSLTQKKKPTPKPAKSGVTQCERIMLQKKDCHLKLSDIKIQVWNDKIFLNDKINRDLRPLPLTGQNVEWQEIRAVELGGRPFLELYLWSDPDPKSQVQSLFWYVLEIVDGRIHQRVHELVQKRKVLEGGSGYKYDDRKKSKLILKNKKVFYQIGAKEGEVL